LLFVKSKIELVHLLPLHVVLPMHVSSQIQKLEFLLFSHSNYLLEHFRIVTLVLLGGRLVLLVQVLVLQLVLVEVVEKLLVVEEVEQHKHRPKVRHLHHNKLKKNYLKVLQQVQAELVNQGNKN